MASSKQSKNKSASASAYAPAHMTGFFLIHKDGSSGAGISLEEGMRTKVTLKKSKKGKNKIEVKINGKKSDAPLSKMIAEEFLNCTETKNTHIIIEHKCKLPVGYGMGMSGAGALSLSLALGKLLVPKMKKEECMEIARIAEIIQGTGLGDVPAQMHPGALYGSAHKGNFEVNRIKKWSSKYVVLGFFSPLDTNSIISDENAKRKINKAGEVAMREFLKKPSEQSFVENSRTFAIDTKLMQGKVLLAMQKFPSASMAMLGNTVFILSNEPRKVKTQLKKICSNVQASKIARKGAHLV